MIMAASSSVVLEGVLKSDGTLELEGRPALPPDRVRVRLELVGAVAQRAELLPDPPWPNESIPAPCDLPLPDNRQPVPLREVAELLPEPFEWSEEDARP